MRRVALALVLLTLASVAQPTEAAFTRALPFDETYPMMKGLGTNGTVSVISGALEVDDAQARGAIGILGADAFTITGLDKVCWREGNSLDCATGQLTVQVAQRSSVGLCLPVPYASNYEAKHVLALFADLRSDNDLNTIPLNRSIVAPAIDGELRLTTTTPIPMGNLDANRLGASPCSSAGVVAGLDGNTTLSLFKDGSLEKSFVGKAGRFLFTGLPTVPIIESDFVVLPFGPTAHATLTPASRKAADEGLDASRVETLVRLLDQSGAAGSTERNGTASDAIKDVPGVIKRLLNGALLQIPSAGERGKVDPARLTFVRVTQLEGSATADSVHWEGKAVLAVHNGHVQHTHSLIGAKMVALPWWSWVLWVAAIALFVTRIVLGPVKRSHWDRLRWIGLVATPLAFLLVFVLVDFEVRRLFGASFLGGTSGKTRLYFFLTDVLFMGLLGVMAGAPLRIILRNTSLLLGQGTFMGLARPVAFLLSFLFGFSYFRDYLDLIYGQVVSRLG